MLEDLKLYVNNRISLAKLETIEVISKSVGIITGNAIIISTVISTMFLGSVSLGFFLGNWLNSLGLGFLIISIFYLLLSIILIIFRRSIRLKITDKTIARVIKKLNQLENKSNG